MLVDSEVFHCHQSPLHFLPLPFPLRLVLGENTLDVAMGTPCGFLQELVTVHPDHTPPEMTVIGRLSHRLICTPDLEAMLAASNSSEQHR